MSIMSQAAGDVALAAAAPPLGGLLSSLLQLATSFTIAEILIKPGHYLRHHAFCTAAIQASVWLTHMVHCKS